MNLSTSYLGLELAHPFIAAPRRCPRNSTPSSVSRTQGARPSYSIPCSRNKSRWRNRGESVTVIRSRKNSRLRSRSFRRPASTLACQKVDLVADQCIPRDVKSSRVVDSLRRLGHADVVVHLVPVRTGRRQRGEVSRSSRPAAGVWRGCEDGAWPGVHAGPWPRAGGATGVQAARRSYR